MTAKSFEITFKIKANTNLDQNVRIVGNIDQLGSWDPFKGHQLTTNMNDYPIWSSPTPILLPKGTKFEFKVVVFENDRVSYWENLPNGCNRRYQVKFYKVTLNCNEGDPTVRVGVLEKVLDTDNMTSAEFAKSKVIKKNKYEFDPFNVAASDDDSWDSPLKADMMSSSNSDDDSDGNDEPKEFNFEMPIKSSFYHSPSIDSSDSFLLKRNVDRGERMRELYAQMRTQTNNRLWHFSNKFTQHDAFYGVNEDDLTIFEEHEMIYIVTFYLPIYININPDGSFEIKPNYTHELLSLYDYCKKYQKGRFLWIGLHKQIPSKIKDEVEEALTEYSCQAIYINPELLSKFKYECKNYLWCHLQKINIASKFEESNDFWTTYELINYRIAEKINSLYDKGYVLINDYRFLLVPNLCAKQKPSIKFHYILNFSFPSSNSFFSIPFYQQIINSIALSWALSFESHDDMSNFIDTIEQIYGGRLLSQSGYLTLQLFGRFIVLNANAQLRREYLIRHSKATASKPAFIAMYLERKASLNLDFEFNEIVFLSVDSLSFTGGLEPKFKALEQLLTMNSEMVGKLKLIQVIKFNSIKIEEEQRKLLKQYEDRVANINLQFGTGDYCPIEIIVNDLQDPKWIEKQYQKAHAFIDTNVDKSNNAFLRSFIEYKEGKAVIIINEEIADRFADYPLTFTTNTVSVNDIAGQIRDCFDIIVNLNDKISCNLYNGKLPLQYVEDWIIRSSMAILKASLLMRNAKVFNTYVLSKCNTRDFVLAACSSNFKKPNTPDIPIKYNNTSNRIFIIPLEALLTNDCLELLKINQQAENTRTYKDIDLDIYDSIKKIAECESNTVVIITKRSKALIDNIFGSLKHMHLLAENGCFYKYTNTNKWTNITDEDFSFKDTVRKIALDYKKKYPDCKILERESEIKLKIIGNLCSSLVEPVLIHLQNELNRALRGNDQIEVLRFQNCVTVRPYNINKGSIIQIILQRTFQEKGKIGFLFCLGKAASDEEIFAGILRSLKMSQEIFPEVKQIFTCVLGHRPSHAAYYVNNTQEMKNLLTIF